MAITWNSLLAVALMASRAIGLAPQTAERPAVASSVADDAVLLDLVVQDKRGKPVVDLKPESWLSATTVIR